MVFRTDRCWPVVAVLMSVGNCASGLEKAHSPRSEDAPGYMLCCTRAESTRLFSYQDETISTFSSGEKTITAFD